MLYARRVSLVPRKRSLNLILGISIAVAALPLSAHTVGSGRELQGNPVSLEVCESCCEHVRDLDFWTGSQHTGNCVDAGCDRQSCGGFACRTGLNFRQGLDPEFHEDQHGDEVAYLCNDDGSVTRLTIPTPVPTPFPVVPTTPFPTAAEPTELPTASPVEAPTDEPTAAPTNYPTSSPTDEPTSSPVEIPTTQAPSESPTRFPTNTPVEGPTDAPTTPFPSDAPTQFPTLFPSDSPTGFPTVEPTENPTGSPTLPTPEPTSAPTTNATASPTTGGGVSELGVILGIIAPIGSCFICCLFWLIFGIPGKSKPRQRRPDWSRQDARERLAEQRKYEQDLKLYNARNKKQRDRIREAQAKGKTPYPDHTPGKGASISERLRAQAWTVRRNVFTPNLTITRTVLNQKDQTRRDLAIPSPPMYDPKDYNPNIGPEEDAMQQDIINRYRAAGGETDENMVSSGDDSNSQRSEFAYSDLTGGRRSYEEFDLDGIRLDADFLSGTGMFETLQIHEEAKANRATGKDDYVPSRAPSTVVGSEISQFVDDNIEDDETEI